MSIIESVGFNATVGGSTPGKTTDQPIITINNPNVGCEMNFEIAILLGDYLAYNLEVATYLLGVKQLGNVVKFDPVAGVTYYTI